MSSPSSSSTAPLRPSVRYRAVLDSVSTTHNGYESTVEGSIISYEQEEHELGLLRANETRKSNNSSSIELLNHDAGVQDGTGQRFTKEPFRFLTLLTDGVVIAVPLVLLSFTITVLDLDGLEVDEQTLARFQNAIIVLATVFPIIFASIVGRLVCETAKWKLEKGATMTTLEQLVGSRTVGATLLTQFKLLALNPLGISLLLIWAFSPLGAQSLLRMLGTRFREKARPSAITYYDTDTQSNFAGREGAYWEGLWLLGSWYSALLLAPESSNTDVMDLWGNVKIPFLSQDGTDLSSGAWRQVQQNPQLESYSALAGLPVTNVLAGNTTFTIESSYLSLDCSKMRQEPRVLMWDDSDWVHQEWGTVPCRNGSWHGFDMLRGGEEKDKTRAAWSLALNRFVDNFWVNRSVVDQRFPDMPGHATPVIFAHEEGIRVGPTELHFEAKLFELVDSYIITADCDIEQTYVESRINCSRIDPLSRQNCSVTAQRPSQHRHAPESILHLSFPQVFRYISKELPVAIGRSWSTSTDLPIQYLFKLKPTDLAIVSPKDRFMKTDKLAFSRRLAQLLNTYLLLSQMFLATSYGSIETNAVFEPNETVTAQVSKLVEVYAVSKPWVALCILSCVVLLLSGVLSVVFSALLEGLGFLATPPLSSEIPNLLICPLRQGEWQGLT
ncbi:hypothetical protein ACJZ2D_006553 [Fusarium nematophilum]